MHEFFFGFALGCFLSLGTAFMATDSLRARNDRLSTEAIERGYALYCPTTGDFAWKGECDE